ncbi:hypothetical protein [Nocardia spumae]|uniref:hypothetical protein n=1 Tax=Nocardia spumae TaxID=2887190 RepID=UPI001D1475E1|nr:hypothetical protein [Nocardia spumae]
MPIANRNEKTDTATDSGAETTPAAADHEIFEPGEPCGVCRFPMGPGKICGNTVYASHGKGALPKYCGQDGQAQWQAQNGTEGNPGHRSDLAGYPRKKANMSTGDAARLAEEEAARRGITRRNAAAAEEQQPAPVPAPAEPATAEPEESADSAIAALAALLTGLPHHVARVREEIERATAEREARIAEEVAKREELAAEVTAEREALATDRAEAQAARERAETEIREARDSRLKTEGQLRSAQARIEELEREIAALKIAHRAEIEEVRRTEREEFRELMQTFAQTIKAPEPAPRVAAVPAVPEPGAQAAMLKRVAAGSVTLVEGVWHQSNAKANTAAVVTLDWLRDAGQIQVAEDGTVTVISGEVAR